MRRVGNHGSTRSSTCLRDPFSDLCYGYNAFWRHCLAHMQVNCDGFEVETLINVRVARAGLRVAEVAVGRALAHARREQLHAGRDGLRVLRTIVTERFRRADGRPRSVSRGVSRALGRSPAVRGRGVGAADLAAFDLADADTSGAAGHPIFAEHAKQHSSGLRLVLSRKSCRGRGSGSATERRRIKPATLAHVCPTTRICANRLRALLADEDAITEKKMFGGLAFLVHGHMSVTLHATEACSSASPRKRPTQRSARPHVSLMEMGGRTMEGWITVAPAGLKTKRELAAWVKRSLTFAATLPPK